MTVATKPDKAVNLEPKINATIDGLTIFSQEFIRLHTELIDSKRQDDPDFYDLVLDPKELVTGFIVKGVNTELLKDYLKVYLEIL